jgi:inosine-uridine nucleoside N-ribohydrolase
MNPFSPLRKMYIDVELKGELTRGMTVADRNQALHKCPYSPNGRVCTDIKLIDLWTYC